MVDRVARREWWKIALLTVPAILLAGSASGWLSGSGEGNPWYVALEKPAFQPPGWAFGVIWPMLYVMLGLALALILAEPDSPRRRAALTLFFVQLALNFAWSPIFFAGHDITLAKYVIYLMAIVAGAAAGQFYRLSRTAGLLMIPYLIWLVFAATVNGAVEKLNPGASSPLIG
jgi:tryptophan-rich sensory protein